MANIWCVLALLGAVYSLPLEPECGYKNCPASKPGVLNVHIVAHTHDDVGWLKTVDQYYYGSRNNIQKAGVQYILDSVVKELWEDPKRRFIYVETAFFWKWWVQQSDEIQSRVRQLVAEERLQFVGGAWSMNDEAAAHYHSTIDQFTWGLSKINATFGPCALPRVGWQIDPFGHSREFANLLAAMGYDGLFLGRIDYQDKSSRLKEKRMEMIWRGDDVIGHASDIFTGVLYNTYSPPPGFCFDVLCNDEPIIDDPASPDFNVDSKIQQFLEYIVKESNSYRSNNVIVTMGGDFTYQDAGMWYTNLDKLIQYANLKAAKDNLNIKLFYSTPNCYLKAVKDANPSLPLKHDDFFPYASDPNSYWTGYFTSRPTTKYFERQGNDYLQMVKQLQVLANLPEQNIFVLNQLKSAMGVMQHHDAITGTEKQHVTHDYERMLTQAVDDSLIIARQAFNKMCPSPSPAPPVLSYSRCRLNESSCHTSENSEQFLVTLYNPLAWKVNHAVRIPVKHGDYEVYAPNGDKISSQLVEIPQQILDIPTRHSKATHELIFIAYLKPLMIKSFYVKKLHSIKKRNIDLDEQINGDNINLFIEDNWRENGFNKRQINYDQHVKELVKMIQHIRDDTDKIMRNHNGDLEGENGEENSVPDNVPDLVNEDQSKKVNNDIDAKNGEAKSMQYEDVMLNDETAVIEKLEECFKLENEAIQIHIDNTSGEIKSIEFNGLKSNLTINFYYYPGCVGNNESPANRSSGAYIFRPNATTPISIEKKDFNIINGKVVKELRFTYESVFYSVRLYTGFKYLEIAYAVGPINIDDDIGKEYVIKYGTDIINNGEFYTDSNGRQMLKRKLNARVDYNVSIAEPVGGNYYPINNNIFIQNKEKRFNVFTDRSQGGSSLVEGEIEVMLHRRLLHDDAFGVGEALNETAFDKGLVVTGIHRISLNNAKENRDDELKAVKEIDMQPLAFVSDVKDLSLADWLKNKHCYAFVGNDLPNGVHLLTVEPWGSKILLRLENYLSDDCLKEVDLGTIFKNIKVKSFKETNLSGNTLPSGDRKWKWTKDEEFGSSFNACGKRNDSKDAGSVIKLGPKEIRSFIIDYEYQE